MMEKYDGITRDVIFLLMDNRFRDSKDFYEEHKEEIKSGIIVPMRQIAAIIGSEFSSLDPLMVTVPTKMVSRIRRDTRFSKDLHLYRENVWIMFMRDKHSWRNYPCFWFEVEPSGYSMGVGFFGNEPGLMETYRRFIRENTTEFLNAVQKCEETGAGLYGRKYKKCPKDCPDGLEEYYMRKDFGFIIESDSFKDLEDNTILNIIRSAYTAFSPMFRFMLKISDDYFRKGE